MRSEATRNLLKKKCTTAATNLRDWKLCDYKSSTVAKREWNTILHAFAVWWWQKKERENRHKFLFSRSRKKFPRFLASGGERRRSARTKTKFSCGERRGIFPAFFCVVCRRVPLPWVSRELHTQRVVEMLLMEKVFSPLCFIVTVSWSGWQRWKLWEPWRNTLTLFQSTKAFIAQQKQHGKKRCE